MAGLERCSDGFYLDEVWRRLPDVLGHLALLRWSAETGRLASRRRYWRERLRLGLLKLGLPKPGDGSAAARERLIKKELSDGGIGSPDGLRRALAPLLRRAGVPDGDPAVPAVELEILREPDGWTRAAAAGPERNEEVRRFVREQRA